jgi:intraflagellar transport protein 52
MDGGAPPQQAKGREAQMRVVFDSCKREQYLPTRGFKLLHRKLKQNATVDVNREEISLEHLTKSDVYVLAAPQEPLSETECQALKQFMLQGGSVLVTGGEGVKFSHLNSFLEPYGIVVREDCVVRTVLHKCLHPKEVVITNGVTNREFNRAAGKAIIGGPTDFGATMGSDSGSAKAAEAAGPSHLSFVYPFGGTLDVQRPAVPILSSGFMAYPLNRPIAAVCEAPQVDAASGKRGRLLYIGSTLPFEDSWLGKEENEKLTTVLFDYLYGALKLNQIDADDPDITDYHHLPDTASLAERLRVAVEESEDLPRDFTQLFDTGMFKFDTHLIPEVVAAHEHLGVKHEPLTLIHPEFHAPLPPRLPATFDPTHRELPPPALDLFDLDDKFAPEKSRLSMLTNKCKEKGDKDPRTLEFFICESAEIMGVTKKLRSPRNREPRALLDFIFRQVVQCKKSSHEGGQRPQPGPAQSGDTGHMRQVRIRANETSDTSPFERNAPWTMDLQMDYSRGQVMGRLTLESSGPNFEAQTAEVRGGLLPDAVEWGLELRNIVGGSVLFEFRGAFGQPQQDGRGHVVTPLQGQVQWGHGEQSSTFLYNAVDTPIQ